ncbi:MAG: DNA repair ATPase [Verrucomicrobiales bacterium]|nr:DNA repair ATPase [Verrucomicrobiales bacterium]
MAEAPPGSSPDTREGAPPPPSGAAASNASLAGATYDLIRTRLQAEGARLRERMTALDERRQEVFGSIEFKLLRADRIVTAHNCLPKDMVQLGEKRFLFGFNVQFGLKREMDLSDVFAIYEHDSETGAWKESPLDVLRDKNFLVDFKRLYNVYEKSSFQKFSLVEGRLYLIFSTGPGIDDIAAFKWEYNDGAPRYLDGRAEAEFRRIGFPPPHEFKWLLPDRNSFRYGNHPHVSIEDRVFVECIGGDLTIKIEDSTVSGEGIYSEPVDDKHQKLDDAEIAYAIVDHLILLKVRPYKENTARFFIFNEKTEQAVRVDSIGQSCVFLPEGHGLIFPDGYYLATGELKQFAIDEPSLVFERVIHAPNGEDSLFVFFERNSGSYALFPYRLIQQRVEERITCNGYSLFPNGNLVLFRADREPQKHHTVQLRQTPFHKPGFEPPGNRDAFLYQVGNKEVVRCLAECNEVLTLVRKESPYAALYDDLVKRCRSILDTYAWLNHAEGSGLNEALLKTAEIADKAVAEFDKVRRLQREAADRLKDATKRSQDCFQDIRRGSFRTLNEFVRSLSALRQLRGELITLKEVRYISIPSIEALEKSVAEQLVQLSGTCVQFLLRPESLDPYRKQAEEQRAAVEKVAKAAEGRKIEKAVSDAGAELEMLIEVVNGLRIEDATETTRIIDGITSVYSTLNQIRAALKKKLSSLVSTESTAQFTAQVKLLSQAAASYLDLCDSPAKCDDYLNRLSVQIEELEGAFADFEEFTVQLTERRTEIYEAFEQRKIALVEQRSRKASALMSAAERILKVIQNRLASFKSLEDINAYVASDQMVAKVRDLTAQLLALEDAVKADDLQGRLKSIQQEAVRQLKDRQELFAEGPGIIKLGRHSFNINTQPLDLTVVMQDDAPHLHLTSTKYFEPILDAAFLATREAWGQEAISESPEVYRAEFLAWQLAKTLVEPGPQLPEASRDPANTLEAILQESSAQRLARVQAGMASRYQDGYTKGVHDLDAARIFEAWITTHHALQLARYSPTARGCALVYWTRFCGDQERVLWMAKLRGFAERNRVFPGDAVQQGYIGELRTSVAGFLHQHGLFPRGTESEAGEYLFHQLLEGERLVSSQEAESLLTVFRQHLAAKGSEETFLKARLALKDHPGSELELVRDWVRGFLLDKPQARPFLEEVAAFLFAGDTVQRQPVQAPAQTMLEGMQGQHPRVQTSRYTFDYHDFTARLHRHERDFVPRFQAYHQIKQGLLERERKRLRLGEFKPRVLSSFVRNQLVDHVYLPRVGDNLAKQIGAAGDAKRTDLMGLLLLISPPGYGKTTLMEYVAARLGIVFVKINGPAIGHAVTSLDPEEAPNAAAREEIHKLNLALEMGDNVLICVDDIQHCNPEFLQKFISLCDGQRKIEGVWRGQPRTYDLRGRKVVVVMAGNPYTESGQKFKIPDMLANRADTYNLGDIIGGSAEAFKASYLENAITSNAVLAPLTNKSQKDIRSFIHLAETGERPADGFEANYSTQELDEIVATLKQLIRIREIILLVNQEYIRSAAQTDDYRTEPPFRLQGSYRNMNRLAEKVVPMMNDEEVLRLVTDHYQGESQTLTTGAESNLLKFRQMIGIQTPDEKKRWEDICATFRRNLIGKGGSDQDPVNRVVQQLSAVHTGLESIQSTLAGHLAQKAIPPQISIDLGPLNDNLGALQSTLRAQAGSAAAPAALGTQLSDGLRALREDLSRAITAVHTGAMAEKVSSLSHEMEMIHSTLATLKDISAQQRDHVRKIDEMLVARAKDGTVELPLTQEMLNNERVFLEKIQQALAEAQNQPTAPAPPPLPGNQT